MKSVILLSIVFLAGFVKAETDLFGAIPSAVEKSQDKVKVIFSGVIDLRFIKTGEAKNWGTGGTGLSLYGAEVNNGVYGGTSNASIGFRVPRISLISDVIVRNEFSAHLQFNYDDHIDNQDSQGRIGIVEAFVIPVLPNVDTQLRLGLLIPPISLEHPSVGWNTFYTITPSAINSWVGEEIRTLTAEVTQTIKLNDQSNLKFLLAGYSGNDPASAILSFRGWAMHDYQYKQGDRLRFQPDIPAAMTTNGWNTPSKELDGRLGFYSKLSYELTDKLNLQLFYLQSNAEATAVDLKWFGNDYGWEASFMQIALKWQPTADITFVSQWLSGSNKMGEMGLPANNPAVRNNYLSWFGLISYQYQQNRFSYRHDYFQVTDLDVNADNNEQKGSAETVAYFRQLSDNNLLGTEFVHILSKRNGNSGLASDASDDLLQVTYRLIF